MELIEKGVDYFMKSRLVFVMLLVACLVFVFAVRDTVCVEGSSSIDFSVITSGGGQSSSDSYQLVDQIIVCGAVGNQSSESYTIVEPIAFSGEQEAVTSAAETWKSY